jgi:hypothetical protein
MKLLPVDLCQTVFMHLSDNKDLLSLCLVSRTFHLEAERRLYHTVILPYDYSRASCWLDRILSEPHRLALFVRVLTLNHGCRLPDDAKRSWSHHPNKDNRVPGFRTKLTRTLRLLPNLTELYLSDKLEFWDAIILFSPMLLGCPFHLRKFHINIHNGEFYLRGPIIPFLAQQPNIIDFSTTHYFVDEHYHSERSIVAFPDTLLPNLIFAQILVPSALRDLRPRSIRRLFVEHWDVSPVDIESFGLLARYADMLTHLRIGVLAEAIGDPSDVPPDVLTSILSVNTPNLKFFHVDFRPPVSFMPC